MEAPDSSEHWEMSTRLHCVTVTLLSTSAKTSELDCQGPTQQPALHSKLPLPNRSDSLSTLQDTQCAVLRLLAYCTYLRTKNEYSAHLQVWPTALCTVLHTPQLAERTGKYNFKKKRQNRGWGRSRLGAADDVSAWSGGSNRRLEKIT